MKSAILFALLLALATGPALAADAVSVKVGRDTLSVPIPDGYCEPKGEYAELVRNGAATDSANNKLVVLFPCADMEAGRRPERVISLDQPKVFAGRRMSREEVIAGMAAVNPDRMAAAVQRGANEGSAALKERSGQALTVDSGIRPAGKDETAFYMAGHVRFGGDFEEVQTATASATTALKGHLITYGLYERENLTTGVAATLERLKAQVKVLAEANR